MSCMCVSGVQHNWDLAAVCRGMIEHAVHDLGVKDNVTALLVQVQFTDSGAA